MTTTRMFLAALALASAVPAFASDTAADRQAMSSTAATTRRSTTTTDEVRAAAAKQTEHRTTCTCTHG